MPGMQKTSAEFCLLHVAMEAGASVDSDVSSAWTGDTVVLDSAAGTFVADGAKVGQFAVVKGFARDFFGLVKAVEETTGSTATLQLCREMNTGRLPDRMADEAAGAEITISWQDATELEGQNDTTYSTDHTLRDVTSKGGGSGTETLATSRGTMTVNANGVAVFGDPVLDRLTACTDMSARQDAGANSVLVKLARSAVDGSAFYGLARVTTDGSGGDVTTGMPYAFALQMSGAVAFATDAQLAA